MKEIWKNIEGYEGLYQVSSYGRVRSLDRMVTYSDGRKRLFKGSMLKNMLGTNGYLYIVLSKSSEEKKVHIHRLVAEAFIPNPNNLPQVNHKDEDKTNNLVENLEWCTQAYNNCFGTRLERQIEKRSMPILQIDLETNQIIAEYPSANEAARKLNIHQGNISECCRGEQKTAYGFKWKYK